MDLKSGVPELLSPAGNVECLHAAVRAGANAVYLGLERFNARRNAGNFGDAEFAEACDYAHIRWCRVYVTMNTIILPEEIDDAVEAARQAWVRGADAFIVQDIGLAAGIMRALPEARLHASTQMNVHDLAGLEACVELGFSRVTLARELSLEEIGALAARGRELGVEIETFVHGALCVCYSGQCFMSSMIGGRSANRGLCAQACRLPYELIDSDGESIDVPGDFLLSPKDLMGADLVGELSAAEVASLKIEGRMKSPEYVFAATSAYRAILDRVADSLAECSGSAEGTRATQAEKDKLGEAFSRGFTTAYLEGERGDSIMSYQRPNNRGAFIGRVKSVDKGVAHIECERPLVVGDVIEFWTGRGRAALTISEKDKLGRSDAWVELDAKARSVRPSDRVFRVRSAEGAFKDEPNEPRVPVMGRARLKIGEPLKVEFATADGRSFSAFAEGAQIEPARSKEVTKAEVFEHIDRMGSTPFKLVNLDIDLDEGVGIGFSQLHHARADALDNLEHAMLEDHKKRKLEKASRVVPSVASKRPACAICAIATNPECARAAKRAGAETIYVPALNYRRGAAQMAGCTQEDVSQAGFPKGCVPMMPIVDHDPCGKSRESLISADPWEYVTPEKPVLVESIGALKRARDLGAVPEIGPRLPIVNQMALEVADALQAECIWLSPELNLSQIEHLAEHTPLPLGIHISGAQELMIAEHCMLSAGAPCNQDCPNCVRRREPHSLRDRKGFEFPVFTDHFGRTHIYNSVPLDIVHYLPDLVRAGVSYFMVDTTLLNAEQAAQATGRAVHALAQALSTGERTPKHPNTTSGHLHRGVA